MERDRVYCVVVAPWDVVFTGTDRAEAEHRAASCAPSVLVEADHHRIRALSASELVNVRIVEVFACCTP
jgi:hypothetical protein